MGGAVGRAAKEMIIEVGRQFREIPGLREGTAKAEYSKCVEISTRAAIREMVLPGLLAVSVPVVVGFFSKDMLAGLLAGVTSSGVLMAIFQSNTGGAWDNAKKLIESGISIDGMKYGKGSDAHKAAVVGDTVGDPFKDTSGPSLNILIKLVTMISLVFGKEVFKGNKEFDDDSPWYVGLIIILVFFFGAVGMTMYLRSIDYGKIPEPAAVEIDEEDMKAEVGFSV